MKLNTIPDHFGSSYRRFFLRQPSLLSYGLSFAFFSSFGQTFLISLFVPFFLADFSLSGTGFGAFYSAATLGSALLLPWAGAWLDRVRLTRFSAAVVGLMALSALLLAVSWNLVVFFPALLGVRLAGQGLSSHTALTAMARYSGRDRGKALSIAGLGFPMGEAVLPLLLAGSISLVGWRQSWALVGGLAAVLFGPWMVWLLHRSGLELDPRKVREADAHGDAGEGTDGGPEARSWARSEVLRDPRFWLVLPAVLLPAFWATGLFLYQTRIAELKGWSLALMASSFVAFAMTRIVFSLVTGAVLDRLSARQVFPFCLVPLGAGLALLTLYDPSWVAFGFMSCLGATMGMAATLQTALWAELYGIRHLGAIKAMMTSLVVLSTAASPILAGFVLDGRGGLEVLLAGAILSVAVATLLALVGSFPGPRPS